MGLVQIVEEAPAVIAERICVTHFFSISVCPKESISQLVNWSTESDVLFLLFSPDVSQDSCGEKIIEKRVFTHRVLERPLLSRTP